MPAPLPIDALSMTLGGVALVTGADGEITGDDAGGLYVRDRRMLAGLHLRINGQTPQLVSRTRTGPAHDRFEYTVHGFDSVLVRQRMLEGGYQEQLSFRSNGPADLQIELDLIPGGATVYHLGNTEHSLDVSEQIAQTLAVEGLTVNHHDGIITLLGSVHLDSNDQVDIAWGLLLPVDQPVLDTPTLLTSASPKLQHIVDNAVWDLEALTVAEPHTNLPFVAAGAPHFLAVFGRDALLASLMTMLTSTERAMTTLEVLAAHQGTNNNPATVEAPGRILHELRIGDMGVFGLEPGQAYFGSVDATPLFVVVLAECLNWGADTSRIARLLPAARQAIAWCNSHVDAHGFVHSLPHLDGIWNQGWKDSGNAVVRADGSKVDKEPNSLVEVQGYVHAALLGLALLEEHVGDPSRAAPLRQQAAEFQERFNQHFLVDAPVHVPMALDQHGAPLTVRASNVGHLLMTQLVTTEMAETLATRLLEPDEWSGWGLRTLASSEPAYNPVGYHLGTVWPHDTALFLRGLAKRGMSQQTETVCRALIDLANALDGQLPELIGGKNRTQDGAPQPYPTSAKPQAWAAAVPIQIAAAVLGFQPDMPNNTLLLRPLPGWDLTVENIQLGERLVHVTVHNGQAQVTGDVEGLVVSSDQP